MLPSPTDVTARDLLVAGELRPARSGLRFGVENPATEDVVAHVSDAGPEDAMAALDAAAGAQPSWAVTAPRERSEILRRAFDLLQAREEEFARLITLEMGKALADARAEVRYGGEFLRWFAEEAVRADGRANRFPEGGGHLMTFRRAVGPCLLITPWNFPLAMGTRKLAPALAAGCTSIVKPAPQTPLTMLALGELLGEAGAPAGTVSVLPTSRPDELCAALLADDRVRKLSFTGSTPVGRLLASRAADGVRRVSLELGGNAPFLVFEDADLEQAVEDALVAKLRNGGEACTAANRFLVHERVAEAFTDRLVERFSSLRLGDGTDPEVDIGPLIDVDAAERVAGLVDDARERGARVRCGGRAPDRVGSFYPPTVLDRVPPDARLLHEEIFGPVAPVVTFRDEDEAFRLANATDAGLVAYLQTRDHARTVRASERLEVGMIGLNRGLISNAAAPFGGIKQSGIGREGGSEGLDEYLETTYLAF